MDTSSWVVLAGAACVVVAIIGGGLAAFKVEVPAVSSIPRQLLLGAFGIALIFLGLQISRPSQPPASTTAGSAPQLPTATPTTSVESVCSANILTCSTPVPIFVQGKSSSSVSRSDTGSLKVSFRNSKNGSGVAFKLRPALGVGKFHRVDIVGNATQSFSFVVEYKVKTGTEVQTVQTSDPQLFPAGPNQQTAGAPLVYNGTIDEIAISCFKIGEASDLFIDSVRLS